MEQTQNQNQQQEKLYAGKFKTVEDLEVGYKNSAAVYDENTKLKNQLDEVTKVPDAYLNPADVELEANRLSNLQARAKESGMTQKQYEKFVKGEQALLDGRKTQFENAKKAVGEETINILSDYVKRNYPQALHDNMLNTFIGNEEARKAALSNREQLLKNTVPGMNKVAAAGGYHVTDEDVRKAYDAKERSKSPKDIQRYLALVTQQATQQRAS